MTRAMPSPKPTESQVNSPGAPICRGPSESTPALCESRPPASAFDPIGFLPVIAEPKVHFPNPPQLHNPSVRKHPQSSKMRPCCPQGRKFSPTPPDKRPQGLRRSKAPQEPLE